MAFWVSALANSHKNGPRKPLLRLCSGFDSLLKFAAAAKIVPLAFAHRCGVSAVPVLPGHAGLIQFTPGMSHPNLDLLLHTELALCLQRCALHITSPYYSTGFSKISRGIFI